MPKEIRELHCQCCQRLVLFSSITFWWRHYLASVFLTCLLVIFHITIQRSSEWKSAAQCWEVREASCWKPTCGHHRQRPKKTLHHIPEDQKRLWEALPNTRLSGNSYVLYCLLLLLTLQDFKLCYSRHFMTTAFRWSTDIHRQHLFLNIKVFFEGMLSFDNLAIYNHTELPLLVRTANGLFLHGCCTK